MPKRGGALAATELNQPSRCQWKSWSRRGTRFIFASARSAARRADKPRQAAGI